MMKMDISVHLKCLFGYASLGFGKKRNFSSIFVKDKEAWLVVVAELGLEHIVKTPMIVFLLKGDAHLSPEGHSLIPDLRAELFRLLL